MRRILIGRLCIFFQSLECINIINIPGCYIRTKLCIDPRHTLDTVTQTNGNWCKVKNSLFFRLRVTLIRRRNCAPQKAEVRYEEIGMPRDSFCLDGYYIYWSNCCVYWSIK
ncbi:hypothetical protein F4805DRAFT_181033 [Annulohypoxylon moriforme]|nr:hypothetical protein F4805DRAFT_181033 [Annulohypoxylon moriforme]